MSNLCINCKFYRFNSAKVRSHRCVHPNNTDLVQSASIYDCHHLRKTHEFCGKDGRWFEPKPPEPPPKPTFWQGMMNSFRHFVEGD